MDSHQPLSKGSKMAFTYDATCSTDRDKVRLLSGDTVSNQYLVEDSEIDFFLDTHEDLYLAAIEVCQVMIARINPDIDRNGLGISNVRSQRITNIETNIKLLEKKTNLVAMASGDLEDDDRIIPLPTGTDDGDELGISGC